MVDSTGTAINELGLRGTYSTRVKLSFGRTKNEFTGLFTDVENFTTAKWDRTDPNHVCWRTLTILLHCRPLIINPTCRSGIGSKDEYQEIIGESSAVETPQWQQNDLYEKYDTTVVVLW